MNININSRSLKQSASNIRDLVYRIQAEINSSEIHNTLAAYSLVSGLDQLAANHSSALSGPSNSAAQALKEYSDQLQWVSGTLLQTVAAYGDQEIFNTRGIGLADIHGVRINRKEYLKPQPMPTIAPFAFGTPVVAPSPKLELLAHQFHATNPAQVELTAQSWRTLGSHIQEVVAELGRISSAMTSSNEGEVINKAAEKLQQLSASGQNFVANAAAMSASVSALNAIHAAGMEMVHAMQAVVAANSTDPARAAIIEQSLLQSFPSLFTPQVLTGVPVIRHLMEIPPATGAGGSVTMGMNSEGSTQRPNIAAVVPPGQMAEHLARAVEDHTGFSLQRPGAADFPAHSLAQIGTQAAQAIPGALQASGLHHGIGAPTTQPATLSPTGLHGASHTGLGTPGGYASLGAHGLSGSGASHGGMHSRFGGLGSLGATGMSPLGAGATSSLNGLGNAGAGSARGSMGGLTGFGSGGSSSGTQSSGMRENTMMSGHGGAGSAAGQRRKGRVKTVTSAVEREGNLLDLLGPRPKVVPRVIGDWVRG
ncbi:hypothetical protein L1O03_10315 [Corynebacterium uropygiale]|uniref:PPE family protein n=1 Tax=Corynebacterium uropygiale TaxID=1775911 RepID=A0A9X1QTN1_9CORY|nr:hypothetical protein [Corynebacterium uropygiale]MCF4007558.1 hypothetical protein [Corynebacterium uropygiale]